MFIGLEILSGTHELVEKEVEKILGQREKEYLFPTLLLVKGRNISEDITLLSLFSRAAINLYLIPKYEKYNNPNDLYRISKDIPWPEIIKAEKSFAVVPKILPERLNRRIVGQLVGQGIVDRFLADKNTRPPVNLRSPDIEVATFIDENKVVLGIKLFKDNMNRIEEAINRLVILSLQTEKIRTLGEIYHTGICESAFEYFNAEPQKGRLLKSTFIELQNIDEEKILNLVTKKWKKITTEIFCFDEEIRKNIPKYKDIHISPLDRLPAAPIEVFLTNLTLAYPSKREQEKIANKIYNLLTSNEAWVETNLIIRTDIQISTIFKAEKIIDITLKGIPSQIIRITR